MKRYYLNHDGPAFYTIVDTQTIARGRYRIVCAVADRAEAKRLCEGFNRYGE